VPDVDQAMQGPASPTFHEFASEWLEARRGELREATIADYTWQLSNHLLPFFHRHRLPQISVAEVDRYRAFKVREQVLSAESMNKTITRLAQILAVAEERDLISRNPVRVNTRNRKLKAKRKRPIYLESAEQIAAMIDAAAELDAKPEARTAGGASSDRDARVGRPSDRRGDRAPMTGHRPRSRARRSPRLQDEAGVRLVDVLPALRDEVLSHRHNPPLPDGVRAHKLRPHVRLEPLRPRRGPAIHYGQLGHTDPPSRSVSTPTHAPRPRRQGTDEGSGRRP
jgi:hypothetical protein